MIIKQLAISSQAAIKIVEASVILLIPTIGQRQDGCTPPIKVQVEVDKEVDTGAHVSMVSENRCHKLWPGRSLSSYIYYISGCRPTQRSLLQ